MSLLQGEINLYAVITTSTAPFKLNYSVNMYGCEEQLHLPFAAYQN